MKTINWSLVLENNQRNAIRGLIGLGGAYVQLGDTVQAEHFYRQAQGIAGLLADETVAEEIKRAIGNLYYHAGKYGEALPYFEGMEIHERHYHTFHIYIAQGNFQQCYEESVQVLTQRGQQETEQEHAWNARFYLEALLHNGLLAEAWKETVKLTKNRHPDLESPHVYIVIWLALARAYQLFGLEQDALHYAARALALSENVGHVPHCASALLLISALQQNPREGVAWLRNIEENSRDFTENPTSYIRVKMGLAKALLACGQPEAAEEEMCHAVTLLTYHRRVPELLQSFLLRIECDLLTAHYAHAMELVEEARTIEQHELRAVHLPPDLPFLYAKLCQRLGDEAQFHTALDEAHARYTACTDGLPKKIAAAMRKRREIRELLEMQRLFQRSMVLAS